MDKTTGTTANQSTEKIIYEGNIPLSAILFNQNIIMIIIYLFTMCIIPFIRSLQNRLKITNERLEYTHGLFTRENETIELFRVKDVNYRQRFIARLFDVGLITLYTSDKTMKDITFPFRKPVELVNILRAEVRAQRKEMGVRTTEQM